MPPAPQPNPFQALADLLGPTVQAIVDQLRLALLGKSTVEKVVAAYHAKEGVELSADEVKALLIVIAGLSDPKKGK